MEQIIKIADFILGSFLHIWPYLLITIPLAVVINLSGASGYITRAFGTNPLLSVFMATVVGAFSPFCSCGVIPVISSLLIGGVPLAPVMSFWIASPSMDPEIFFLSSSLLGWKLAIWRLASTFVISLMAGYITHYLSGKGFISNNILKNNSPGQGQIRIKSLIESVRSAFNRKLVNIKLASADPSVKNNICCTVPAGLAENDCCCTTQKEVPSAPFKNYSEEKPELQFQKVWSEIMKATLMVAKFMGIAFFITALINFYMPEDIITWIINANPAAQVALATIIGIPVYTSNITAMPIAGGLIDAGLNKGAALSFLIAGATTTLPAMIAVWGITKTKVFILYISFALFGALLAGFCFNLFG